MRRTETRPLRPSALALLPAAAEVVTPARKNCGPRRDVVERMGCYAAPGAEFRARAPAPAGHGDRPEDLHDIVLAAPSAITGLAHRQLQDDARIAPRIMARRPSVEVTK